jgi:hypothetical protein
MYCSFMLACAAALGLAAPLTFTPHAQAGPRLEIDIRAGSYPYRPAYRGYYRGYGYGVRYGRYYPPVPVDDDVDPGYVRPPRACHYHVLYRTCHHTPWREYGTYHCHELAHEVEESLLARGYEARVVHH